MTIVIGRGKNRTVYELPCGAIVRDIAKHDPKAYQISLDTVCKILLGE